MTKKIIFISVLIFFLIVGFSGSAASKDEVAKAGILPDSPFYFLDKIGEGIGSIFTFSNQAKSDRYLKLINERLAEAEALGNKNNLEAKNKALIQIALKVWQRQQKLASLYEQATTEKKPEIQRLINREKQKFEELLQKLPTAEREKVRDKIREQASNNQETSMARNPEISGLINVSSESSIPESVVGVADQSTNLTEPDFLEIAPSDDKGLIPIVADQNTSSGKPGMEDGSGQVVRPKGIGDCNSKLYLCKIQCGEDIINHCNEYSAPRLYDLLMCRGECTHYNLFYGCGMEAGCDEPCWDEYDSHCSPDTYQACIENCEETFAD